VFHVTEGTDYTWSLCSNHGADAPYDSELTLWKESDETFLVYSDNACSDDGKISWTAYFTGNVSVVLTRSGCLTGGDKTTLAYKSGASAEPYLDLYFDDEVLSAAGTASLRIQSNSAWTASDDAGWITTTLPRKGGGDAWVDVSYNENPTPNQRTGEITVATSLAGTSSVTLTQFPSDAWCNTITSYAGTLFPTNDWQYTTLMWAGTYAVFPVVSGTQYHWSLCPMHGASSLYDAAEITLRRAENNAFIAYSDSGCGSMAGNPVLSWTAGFTGNVKIIVTKTACLPEYRDTRLAYKSGDLTDIPLSLSAEYIVVDNLPGTFIISIFSDDPWFFDPVTKTTPGWITSIEPMQGSGNAVVTVTYAANQNADQREQPITAHSGNNTAQLTIRQMPNDGHCNSVRQSGGLMIPTENWDYDSIIKAGSYSMFKVDSGIVYHWSLCPSHGGLAPFDSRLTLRRENNNVFIAENNNTCGDDARITWASDFNGKVKLVLTRNPCDTSLLPVRLAFKSGVLSNPYPVGPLPMMTPPGRTVPPVGDMTTFNIASNTSWELSTVQDWITLSRTKGKGNATITVEYQPDTGSSRTANINGTVKYVTGSFGDNTVTQFDYCSGQKYTGPLTAQAWWIDTLRIPQGQYAEFNVTAGEMYQWSLCAIHGGFAPFPSELTLRKAGDNSFIAWSNSYYGNGPAAYLPWIADMTGIVKVVVTGQPCQADNQILGRLAYKKGRLELPYVKLDPAFTVVEPAQGELQYTLTSNTIWSLSKNAGWMTFSNPVSGAGNSAITVNYDANPGLERIGSVSAISRTDTAPVTIFQKRLPPPVPANLAVGDTSVFSFETVCFNALQFLEVGGANGPFTVYDTGAAWFIAGQRISFYPGTTVQQGGYLDAEISDNGHYCDIFIGSDQPVGNASPVVNESSATSHGAFFRIYPNPTPGSFTLEFTSPDVAAGNRIELYSPLGRELIEIELPDKNKHLIDISSFEPGLYLIRVMRGRNVGTCKIIRQ